MRGAIGRWRARRRVWRARQEREHRLLRDRLFERLFAVVAEEAGEAVAAGRALLETEHCGAIVLSPSHPGACGIEIHVEAADAVHCGIGAAWFPHEVYSEDQDAIVADVRCLVRALVAGEYVEESTRAMGMPATAARWPSGEITMTSTYMHGEDPDKADEPLRTYEPY